MLRADLVKEIDIVFHIMTKVKIPPKYGTKIEYSEYLKNLTEIYKNMAIAETLHNGEFLIKHKDMIVKL